MLARRAAPIALLGAGLLVAAAILIPGPAAAAPGPLFGLFMVQGSGGPELSLTPSDGATQKLALLKSIRPEPNTDVPLCASVRCEFASLGTITLPAGGRLSGQAAIVLWLSTDQTAPAMPLLQLSVALRRIGATNTDLVSFTYGNGNGGGTGVAPRESADGTLADTPLLTLTSTAQRLSLSGTVTPVTLNAGDVLRLDVTAAAGPVGSTVEAAKSNVLVNYGAAAPTGFLGLLDAASGAQLGGDPLALYLSGAALSTEAPSGTTPQTRIVTSSVGPNDPPAITFTAAPLAGPSTAIGDALFVLHLQLVPKLIPSEASAATSGPRPSATLRLSVLAGIDVGDGDPFAASGIAVVSVTVVTPQSVVISLPTLGKTIPATATLSLKIYGVAHPEAGDVALLYGSEARASGVRIPVEGGSGGPPSTSQEPSPLSSDPAPPTTTSTTPVPTTPIPTSDPIVPPSESTPSSPSEDPVTSSPAGVDPTDAPGSVAATKDMRGNASAWGALTTLSLLAVLALARRRT